MKYVARFEGGVAGGLNFQVTRVPLLLRIAVELRVYGDEFRALDAIGSAPTDRESVVIYRASGQPSVSFVDGRDPKTGERMGWQQTEVTYVPFAEKLDRGVPRTWETWERWCVANRSRLLDELEVGSPGGLAMKAEEKS